MILLGAVVSASVRILLFSQVLFKVIIFLMNALFKTPYTLVEVPMVPTLLVFVVCFSSTSFSQLPRHLQAVYSTFRSSVI